MKAWRNTVVAAGAGQGRERQRGHHHLRQGHPLSLARRNTVTLGQNEFDKFQHDGHADWKVVATRRARDARNRAARHRVAPLGRRRAVLALRARAAGGAQRRDAVPVGDERDAWAQSLPRRCSSRWLSGTSAAPLPACCVRNHSRHVDGGRVRGRSARDAGLSRRARPRAASRDPDGRQRRPRRSARRRPSCSCSGCSSPSRRRRPHSANPQRLAAQVPEMVTGFRGRQRGRRHRLAVGEWRPRSPRRRACAAMMLASYFFDANAGMLRGARVVRERARPRRVPGRGGGARRLRQRGRGRPLAAPGEPGAPALGPSRPARRVGGRRRRAARLAMAAVRAVRDHGRGRDARAPPRRRAPRDAMESSPRPSRPSPSARSRALPSRAPCRPRARGASPRAVAQPRRRRPRSSRARSGASGRGRANRGHAGGPVRGRPAIAIGLAGSDGATLFAARASRTPPSAPVSDTAAMLAHCAVADVAPARIDVAPNPVTLFVSERTVRRSLREPRARRRARRGRGRADGRRRTPSASASRP